MSLPARLQLDTHHHSFIISSSSPSGSERNLVTSSNWLSTATQTLSFFLLSFCASSCGDWMTMILPGPGAKVLIVRLCDSSTAMVSNAIWIESPVTSLILKMTSGSLY